MKSGPFQQKARKERHGYVFASRVAGPNVFVDCVMTQAQFFKDEILTT